MIDSGTSRIEIEIGLARNEETPVGTIKIIACMIRHGVRAANVASHDQPQSRATYA